MKDVAAFLYEVGFLSKMQRTGFAFLGTGQQNVAEHTNRVCYIGYTLAMLDGTVDTGKVVMMCLFHDMTEIRSLDHNYVAQKYVKVDEQRILDDQVQNLPFKDNLKGLVHEYETRESMEAIYAKEADVLELILVLKQELDLGNMQAKDWLNGLAEGRLKTELGKQLAESIMQTRYDQWWYTDKNDQRWINRNGKG